MEKRLIFQQRHYLSILGLFCLLLLLSGSAPFSQGQVEPPFIPTSAPPPAGCVGIMGDSIAYGSTVTMAPGVNFFEILLPSFASVMRRTFIDHQIARAVRDYALPAVYLRDGGESQPGYLYSAAFWRAINDGCEVMVIFPWLNELPSSNTPESYDNYFNEQLQLIDILREYRPEMRIIVVTIHQMHTRYTGQVTYGDSVTEAMVRRLRERYAMWCSVGNVQGLAQYDEVACWFPFDNAQPRVTDLMHTITHQDFIQENMRIVGAPSTALDGFWSSGGVLEGDGIHYSPAGMRTLARALVRDFPQWLAGGP